jgi:putative peptidoglycan lipid II flippase
MFDKFSKKEIILPNSFLNTAFLSVLFNALGKGIYFISVLMIGRMLGGDIDTDVYFYTISFVAVIVGFSTLINGDVLIPKTILLRDTSTEDETNRFLSFFYTTYALIGIILVFLIFLFPQLSFHLFSKYTPEVISNKYLIFTFLIPSLLFNMMSSLQSSVLIAHDKYIIPSVVTFGSNLFSFLLFFAFWNELGIYAGILGILSGGLIANLVLGYNVKKHCKISLKPTLRVDFSIFNSIGYVTFAYVVFSLYSFAILYLFTTTYEGLNTVYNNAQLIAFLPYQFIGVQLTTIIANKFTHFYDKQQYAELKKFAIKALFILSIIVLPMCLFAIFFAKNIVELIAGHNNKDEVYKHNFVMILQYLAIPAFFNTVYLFAIRLYTATFRIKTSSLVQSGICIVIFIFSYIGLKYYNLKGFCIANVITYGIMALVGVLMIVRFFKILDQKQASVTSITTDTKEIINVQ